MHCFNSKTASFSDKPLARITFGYSRHNLNRQIIGPHLKGKTGVQCHAIARNDTAIFTHRIPALPVFHGRKDAPDYRQGGIDFDIFFR